MIRFFNISDSIKSLVFIFITLTISGCTLNYELVRKPLYQGPIRPKDKIAILMDYSSTGNLNMEVESDNSFYEIQSYIYQIDNIIINTDGNVARQKFDAWTQTVLDLLPGKHLIKLRTMHTVIPTDYKPSSIVERVLHANYYYYYNIPDDIEVPEIEFDAKPGVMYCAWLHAVTSDYTIFEAKVSPCKFRKTYQSSQIRNTFIPEP